MPTWRKTSEHPTRIESELGAVREDRDACNDVEACPERHRSGIACELLAGHTGMHVGSDRPGAISVGWGGEIDF